MNNKEDNLMTQKITLLKQATVELVEKKSVFIGHAKPVETETEAADFVSLIRKKHSDATHNVFAYMLNGGSIARYSDDGEPQGTAGIPVLDIIKKGGFCDAVIVVTRYFGGTLLGAGGLVRAYSAVAKLAVDAAGIVTYEKFSEITLKCNYTDHGKLAPVLADKEIICDGTEFTDSVKIKLAIPQRVLNAFKKRVSDITAGRSIIVETGSRFDCIL